MKSDIIDLFTKYNFETTAVMFDTLRHWHTGKQMMDGTPTSSWTTTR
jgi:hypothetical protein